MSTPTLLTYYKEKVTKALQAKHNYANVHQIPRLEKIVVTTCMGKHPDRKQAVEDAVAEIAKITGQKPAMTYARKSVANFKLREGEVLGARVTLRSTQMWEFLDR
ncbi:MAG: 50S ribosomal protein L5, partial [Akkermansia sp.]|nr:50S ribosomal protein L5 [Akkermansia sp.]MBQ9828917.1 50S ribosomal protein L5 [Akkermansia sp.]